MDFDPATLTLSFRLGLGHLGDRNLCSGYQNACPCMECRARAKSVAPEFHAWLEGRGTNPPPQLFSAPERAAQPWDLKAA